MFAPGSLEDRLARAIYAEAPALTVAGDPVGFDLANVVRAAEVSLACHQAQAAAEVLTEYQELWVHLMWNQLRLPDEVADPGLFPVLADDSEVDVVGRRAYAVAEPVDYCPRHVDDAGAGPSRAATLLAGEWEDI